MNFIYRLVNSIKTYGLFNSIKVFYLKFCRNNQFYVNFNLVHLKGLFILKIIPLFISPIFLFEKNKLIRTAMSFKASYPDKDPFVKFVKEINEKKIENYEGSSLEKYYANFRPTTIYDLYPYTKKIINSKIFKLKAKYINHILPWDETFYKKTLNEIIDEVDLQKNIMRKCQENNLKFDSTIYYGNQNFGPVHNEMGKLEFERYKKVLNSINKIGYKPDYKNNPHISGQILKNKNSWMLLISDGVHRATVLIALEFKKYPISLKVLPKIIDRNKVYSWPGVTRKYYTQEEALIIFDSIFESNNNFEII